MNGRVWIVAALALAGCSGADGTSTSAGRDAGGADASRDSGAALKLGRVTATVRYSGGRTDGQLSLGAFTENPPRTRPPVAFDTSTTPQFPHVSELRGLEPGHYWTIAVLDFPPYSPGSPRPGPEDLTVTSDGIDVAGDDVHAVELLLAAPDGG